MLIGFHLAMLWLLKAETIFVFGIQSKNLTKWQNMKSKEMPNKSLELKVKLR